METIKVNKQALVDLLRLKDEFELIVESLEIMNNPEIIESLKKSEEQIKKREFADWDEL
jgi:hypothetical protein